MTEWREVFLGEGLEVHHGFAFKGEPFRNHGDLIVLTPGNFGLRPLDGCGVAVDPGDLIASVDQILGMATGATADVQHPTEPGWWEAVAHHPVDFAASSRWASCRGRPRTTGSCSRWAPERSSQAELSSTFFDRHPAEATVSSPHQCEAAAMIGGVTCTWRGPITDDEMLDLVDSCGGNSVAGWWNQIRPHSLGWAAARDEAGQLVGFVNVAWDGSDHAFLIDTKTRGGRQREGIATRVVRHAALQAKVAGCQWLHVDFRDDPALFYFDACGFTRTEAGLIDLYAVHE